MELSRLQSDMIAAMKARDKERKDSISALVSAVKKAAIDAGCREDVPEDMVDRTILKEMKTVQEQIDSCPPERGELLAQYKARYAVFQEYAPKLMSAQEIEECLKTQFAEVVATGNKGMIMKTVVGSLKGKADGKLIGEVVAKLCR